MNLINIDRKKRAYSKTSKILSNRFNSTKLCQILEISYATARRLQRGHTDLTKSDKTLLELILDKRIIPEHWPSDITFEDDHLLHGSAYNLNWGQVEQYSWVCQQWGATLHHVESLRLYIDKTITQMTETQQRKIMDLRMQMVESTESNQPYNIYDPIQTKKARPTLKTDLLKQEWPINYPKKLCYQFSNIKLQEILGISYATVRRLKRGDSTLKNPQLRLLELILNKRIMPAKWPRNITFENDGFLHVGRHNISWGQVEQFSWVCQKWGETIKHVTHLNGYINEIIANMNEIEQVQAMNLRQAIIQKVELEHPYQTLQLAH